MNFQEVFQKRGGDGGNDVHMREGNTWRVMVTYRPYGEFYDLYSVSPELLGYHLVYIYIYIYIYIYMPDCTVMTDRDYLFA
jgi:hypothetical protein